VWVCYLVRWCVGRRGRNLWDPIEEVPSILARRRLGHRAVWGVILLLGAVLVLHSALLGLPGHLLLLLVYWVRPGRALLLWAWAFEGQERRWRRWSGGGRSGSGVTVVFSHVPLLIRRYPFRTTYLENKHDGREGLDTLSGRRSFERRVDQKETIATSIAQQIQ
jgi:hypothetical protein